MGATTRQRKERQPGTSFGSEFHARRGTGEQPFPLRLARARLLHLRRRDTAANWLALTISIALYFLIASLPAHVSLAGHAFVAANRRLAQEHSRESTVESIANEVM